MPRTARSKYQFFITFQQGVLASAASKPVLDTSKTLSQLGYKDYSLRLKSSKRNISYYTRCIYAFVRLFFRVKSNSIIATQSPLPTVNRFISIFIKLAKIRGIFFITIVHDVDSLRLQRVTDKMVRDEVKILNSYNGIIVHNSTMDNWLRSKGLSNYTKVCQLNLFDYLDTEKKTVEVGAERSIKTREIVFAGHLEKSDFIYDLGHIKDWQFNIYGSDFKYERNKNDDTVYKGEFPPDEIVYHLEGSFGLVWDGADSRNIETNRFGNYMRFNNPFKFSLYLAAGLPVIAPKSAAIAKMIVENKIGFVISTLEDLNTVNITDEDYCTMRQNVKVIQQNIVAGNYLKNAVQKLETLIEADF